MPVFISHRTVDNAKAYGIARVFRQHDIPYYLDDFDPDLQSTTRVTEVLVNAINRCTHLMALVTTSTRFSWWVPFEIGIAHQAPRRISTYNWGDEDLPDYLEDWPILRSELDLQLFCHLYKQDASTISSTLSEKRARASIQSPHEFHQQLKSVLGQL